MVSMRLSDGAVVRAMVGKVVYGKTLLVEYAFVEVQVPLMEDMSCDTMNLPMEESLLLI